MDVAARERKSRRRRWLRRGGGRGGDTEEAMMVGLCGGRLGLRRVAVADAEAIVGTLEKRCKNLDHFSIYACHPCAGAMLIFSVSFQIW